MSVLHTIIYLNNKTHHMAMAMANVSAVVASVVFLSFVWCTLANCGCSEPCSAWPALILNLLRLVAGQFLHIMQQLFKK